MFERFLAPERGEPPDIDIDIESDRREEVIQHVYEMHGREHAAQVANVISYRPKSAVRDIAKALGYSPGQQDAWSKEIERGYYWSSEVEAGRRREVPAKVVELAGELQNAPRHLGIHSGGMVMCDRPVIEVCPVEWGRMPGRTVLQWDKDDCAEIGLVKFDLLGLGMLSAIQYCFELIDRVPRRHLRARDDPDGSPLRLRHALRRRLDRRVPGRVPRADGHPAAAEAARSSTTWPSRSRSSGPDRSRATRCIRTSGARTSEEEITYPHPRLEEPLKRTLGIPLFQEQLMQIAVAVADFTPAEADQLRRAMGSKRSRDKIDAMRIRLYDGMAANGITGATADEIYEKIQAFAAFGFAEIALDQLRVAGVRVVLAQAALPGRVLRGIAECAADGLLLAAVTGPRRQAARHRGAQAVAVALAGRGVAGAGRRPVAVRLSGCAATGGAARVWRRCARSAPNWPRRSWPSRETDGAFTSMADLARRVGLSADQVEALATSGAFDCFGAVPPRRAVGGRGGGHRPSRSARRRDLRRDGAPGAAGDDRTRTADRRHVGHRR